MPRVGECRTDIEIWIDLAAAMARHDKFNPLQCWTGNLRAGWDITTSSGGGMAQPRMEQRAEPLRWPCPEVQSPGICTLNFDHPSWYAAALALDPKTGRNVS